MSTITTLNENDNGEVSRGVINTNFDNLNIDKVEGPDSSINENIAVFDGVSGKLLKDNGINIGSIMNKDNYDPSSIEKDVFSKTNLVYTDSNNGDDTTGNGSIKAPYKTIQFAIDSITTQSIDNKFQIIIYPGVYTENITLKGYVDLWGPGVVIKGSSGILLTLTDNVSIIERITFELNPTTSGNSILSCSTGSGNHELNFCEFNINSSTNGITSSIANISSGSVLITDSLENYTMTGSSAISNTHKIFNITSDGSFNFFRNTLITSIDDENDIIYEIYESSTGLILVVDILSLCFINNASYSGKACMFGIFGTGIGNKLIFQNVMQIIGSGSGTGIALEVDSPSNDLIVESYYNRFAVLGFTNNNNTSIGSGDTVESFFNRIDAIDSDIGSGSITKLQAESGELRVNTAIIDETLLLGNPDNKSLEQLFNISFNSGYVSGGVITDNGDGTIDVSAGTGLIRESDSNISKIKSFNWTDTTGITLVDNSNNIIYIDYNSGNPVVLSGTDRGSILDNEHDKFELVEIVREGLELHISDHRQTAVDVGDELQRRFYSINPVERANNTGLILGETGTRNITISAGSIWRKLIIEQINSKDTSISDSFDRYYSDGASGWIKESSQTQWDNLQYDDGTGNLATLTNNRYSFQDFYLNGEGNIVSLYGQNEYNSLASAEEAPTSSNVPIRIEFNSILIGRIVFQKSDTTAQSVLSSFTTTFSAGATSDHGNLSGLGNNDHPQYALVGSSNTFTGNQTFENFIISNGNTIRLQRDGNPNYLHSKGTSGVSLRLCVGNSTNANDDRVMTLTDSGNVGIGITGPSAKLDILQSNSQKALNIVNNVNLNGAGFDVQSSQTAGYICRISGSGNKSASGQRSVLFLENTNSSATAPVLKIENSNSSGVGATIEGNVGIGTTSPGEKLHVNGGIRLGTTSNAVAGNIRWNGTKHQGYDGTAWRDFY